MRRLVCPCWFYLRRGRALLAHGTSRRQPRTRLTNEHWSGLIRGEQRRIQAGAPPRRSVDGAFRARWFRRTGLHGHRDHPPPLQGGILARFVPLTTVFNLGRSTLHRTALARCLRGLFGSCVDADRGYLTAPTLETRVMTHLRRRLLACVAAPVWCAAGWVLASPSLGRADPVEEVHELLDRIERAWEQKDLDALDRDCLDDDMLTIRSVQDGLEEGAWVFDRQADLDRIAGIMERAKLKCQVVGREISVQGDIAWMRLTVAFRASGRRYAAGRMLALALRRDGAWKWSFSMPLFVRSAVVVTEVSGGSQAERLGIKTGDVMGACGTWAVCDDDALARWAEAGKGNDPQKTMSLVVIRGTDYLRFGVSRGDLGILVEERLLPEGGAVLVEAHQDHPIKQRLRERLDAVERDDPDSVFNRHLCPQGYFSVEPVESGAPRVTTRNNMRQRWDEEVPGSS